MAYCEDCSKYETEITALRSRVQELEGELTELREFASRFTVRVREGQIIPERYSGRPAHILGFHAGLVECRVSGCEPGPGEIFPAFSFAQLEPYIPETAPSPGVTVAVPEVGYADMRCAICDHNPEEHAPGHGCRACSVICRCVTYKRKGTKVFESMTDCTMMSAHGDLVRRP